MHSLRLACQRIYGLSPESSEKNSILRVMPPAPFSSLWSLKAVIWEVPRGPWEQQDGQVEIWNRICSSFVSTGTPF